jgi:nitroreductase
VSGQGEGFAAIAATLVPANRIWAERAPVLLITCARLAFEHNEEPNAWAQHDLGLAMGQLAIEATARGLIVHQMGGFDPELARTSLRIPDEFLPLTAVALGHPGSTEDLGEELAAREAAPRTRKPLAEVAFEGHFGKPFPA